MPTFSITRDPTRVGIGLQAGNPVDTLTYTIRCTSGTATDTEAVQALESQFPVSSAHPDWGDTLVAADHALIQVSSPGSAWAGTVRFVPVTSLSTPGTYTDSTSLLALPVKVESIDTDFYSEVSDVDIYGKAICNSAGDAFDPPGYVERSREIIVLSRYKQNYVADTYKPFLGRLNNADVQIAGLGACTKRTLRCLTIKPAAGYLPSFDVPISASTGTISPGAALTWTGGGTGVAVSITGGGGAGVLRIMNANISVANGTIINGPGGATATASATALLAPVKLLWVMERREAGFDMKVIDRGYQAFWTNGSTVSKAHIFTAKDSTEVASPVNLRQGAPAVTGDYRPSPKTSGFSAWSTANDALATRTAGGTPEVVRTTAGNFDFLTFKRIEEANFANIGL